MSDQELDHCPVIQDFHHFVASSSLPGIVADVDETVDVDRRFLPLPDLERYFSDDEDDDRLLNILKRVLPSTGPPSVAPSTVRSEYLKVFAILLSIGKSYFIECFVIHPGLKDIHLPFVQRPPNFPTSPDFFNAFYERQWMFCSPEVEYKRVMVLPARTILPITEKIEIGNGGDAIVHRIVVHPAYNKLHSHIKSSLDPSDPLYNTFVLKSYHCDSGEQYNRELKSFVHLRSFMGPSTPNIIGFYGSYTHGRTSNIILEYANEGALEDYFERVPPPSTGPEIYQFWSGLLSLLRALDALHDLPYEGKNFVACHQDITPKNILVCRREGQSIYESEFKLADLGLSHIHIDGITKGEDAGGTRIYGAPEQFRHDNTSRYIPHIITPAADIWSLGCLFSEAAVWLVHGLQGASGLHIYRAHRQEETRNTASSEDLGCFHNGAEVLSCVATTHKTLLDNIRRCDTLTEDVLVLIEVMLVPYTSRRHHSSSSLLVWASVYLKKRKDMSLQSRHPRNGRPISALVTPAPSRKLSSEVGLPDPGLKQERHPEVTSPVHLSPIGAAGYLNNGHYPDSPVSPQPSRLSNNRLSMDGGSSLEPLVRCRSAGPDYDHYGAPGNSYRPLINNTANFNTHPLGYGPGPSSLAANPPKPILEGIHYPGHHSYESSSSLGRSGRPTCDLTIPDKPISHSQSESSYSALPPNGNSPRGAFPPPEAVDKLEMKLPKLPVLDALTWRGKTRRMPSKEAIKDLPDEYVRNELGERDHVFLLDDSTSMRPNWRDVVDLLDLIACIVSGSDPDGEDVYFTIGNDHKKSKSTDRLVEFAKDHCAPPVAPGQPPRYSNIDLRLGEILQEYHSRLDNRTNNTTKHHRSPSFLSRSSSKTRMDKLNLYIFTDGAWQPQSDAKLPIASIVGKLEDLRMGPGQIGIQFIQFGNDAGGTKRLNELDTELGLKRDVVDVEPFEGGNVWKMLLGSINKWYDSDDRAANGGDNHPPLPPPLLNGASPLRSEHAVEDR